jgi:acetylornithine deacetylase/succinyl-diaminopimelate desuccinylase family protein
VSRLSSLDRLLWELVEIPSINPSLEFIDADLTGEERIAQFLEGKANSSGIEYRRMKVLPGRENLVIRLKPAGKIKNKVMLTPHMDVVPATPDAFVPKIKNGCLYGRGACDTKGSIASFFHAFLRLAKERNRPKNTEIIFVGLVDEEFGQAGSRALAKKGPVADLAIAGEPTNLKVVSAHKGNLWIRLSTQGKAAHGSTPQYGNNAINDMSPILDTLTNEYPKLLSDRKHPLLGSPTISVGTIRGGSQPNVVPDSCEIDIDRRTIPGETDESVKKEMKNLFRKLKIKSPEFSATRSVPCPPLDTDPSLPIIQSFLKASNRRRTIGVPYFTDASPISMGGTPALVYGPGNIAQAHSKNEWVSLEEVEKAEQSIFRFLSNLE